MTDKRVHTAWRVRRRYRLLWRGGFVLGVLLGALWVVPGWLEAASAGALGVRRLATGFLVIALAGWIPYALFRRLWIRRKLRHYAEWGL